jgi:hypothetical protein
MFTKLCGLFLKVTTGISPFSSISETIQDPCD